MVIEYKKDSAKRAFEGLEAYDAGYKDGVEDMKLYFLTKLKYANENHKEDMYEFLVGVIKYTEY